MEENKDWENRMSGLNIEKHQLDYLYVLRTAVRQERLDARRVETIDPGALFQMAFEQAHAALFYQCFLDSGLAVPEQIAAGCRLEMDHGIHREALMNVERGRIFAYLDEQQIWHCPLKGIVIQQLYPMLGMRYSADNDILIDPKGCRKLRDFMKKRGYKVNTYGSSHHDVYIKNPSYHFEFHRRLLSHLLSGNAANRYFETVEERFVRDEEHPYDCRLSNEDFYLHMITHMYNHFISTGTGLRSVVDIYYYCRQYSMNEAYVDRKLDEFGMMEFAQAVRNIAERLFGETACGAEAWSAYELEILDYLFHSGVGGSMEIYARNMLKQCRARSRTVWGAKVRYVWMRLFPSMDYYETDHPFLYRHKILIPGFVVYRLLRAIFVYHKPRLEFGVLNESEEG